METLLGMAVEQKEKSIKIHLDNYIKDSAYIKKSLRPKKVPISLGVVFKAEDIPESPDPRKQKQYRSFVAKLQFAATWIRFDISFVVSQLARFCASAGETQWAALRHLMEYLVAHPMRIHYRLRSLLMFSDKIMRTEEWLFKTAKDRRIQMTSPRNILAPISQDLYKRYST